LTSRFWRARRRLFLPLSVAALVMVVSSCYYGPAPNITFTEMYERGSSPGRWYGMLPWVCHSEGVGGAHGGHDHGLANPAYEGKDKGDLSWEDCREVVDFMDKALASAMRYPTRGAAKAAGSRQAVQFVPGLGTHDSIPGVSTIGLDPERPLFLQYDGMGDDAPLAGMSWLVYNGSSTEPPEGLPGDNDWWHTHLSLCYSGSGTVIGNEISDEQCASMGGTNRQLPGIWMIHAWIVPGYENVRDVFSGAFMCVRGTGPVTDRKDPCHDDLTDPEHPQTTTTAPGTGTPPTTDAHGHTDEDHANMTTTTAPGTGTPPTTDAHGHTDEDHANMTTTTASPTTTVTTAPPSTTTTTGHAH
jgi:hypothetical protein